MGMNRPLTIVVGVGLLLLQGCVLPVPFKTMHSATYRGKVLDVERQGAGGEGAGGAFELWRSSEIRP